MENSNQSFVAWVKSLNGKRILVFIASAYGIYCVLVMAGIIGMFVFVFHGLFSQNKAMQREYAQAKAQFEQRAVEFDENVQRQQALMQHLQNVMDKNADHYEEKDTRSFAEAARQEEEQNFQTFNAMKKEQDALYQDVENTWKKSGE